MIFYRRHGSPTRRFLYSTACCESGLTERKDARNVHRSAHVLQSALARALLLHCTAQGTRVQSAALTHVPMVEPLLVWSRGGTKPMAGTAELYYTRLTAFPHTTLHNYSEISVCSSTLNRMLQLCDPVGLRPTFPLDESQGPCHGMHSGRCSPWTYVISTKTLL